MSDIEGYTHLCDACAAGEMMKELEAQWESELATYSKRVGEPYDFDEFVLGCWGEDPDIDLEKIKDLPELKEVYETERSHYQEYMDSPELRDDPPWKLNIFDTELPF